MLRFTAIQTLFNKFFGGVKFFRDLLDAWMSRPDARIRLFGVTRVDYLAMNDADKHAAPGISRRSARGQISGDLPEAA